MGIRQDWPRVTLRALRCSQWPCRCQGGPTGGDARAAERIWGSRNFAVEILAKTLNVEHKIPPMKSNGLPFSLLIAQSKDGTIDPDILEFSKFIDSLGAESDRGMALVAASMIDEQLSGLIGAFLVDCKEARNLLNQFGAPLGTLAARTMAAKTLGLVDRQEYLDLTAIRKIRNKFGHAWLSTSFDTMEIASLIQELPWYGPKGLAGETNNRERFLMAVAVLLANLMWRIRLAEKERRIERIWPRRL